MTSSKTHSHKKGISKMLRDNSGKIVGKSHRGRIIPVVENKTDKTEFTPNRIKTTEPVPVKRGQCKSEVIHSNGKTRPIRDEKGHFIGSESIAPALSDKNRKEQSDLNKESYKKYTRLTPRVDPNEICFKTVHSQKTGKDYTVGEIKRNWHPPVKNPDVNNEKLKLYRIYVANGTGYRYELSTGIPTNHTRTELVMTLYDPKVDLTGLERAIRNYQMDKK